MQCPSRVDAKKSERGGVKISETPGVRLLEITMREFAVQDSFCGLAEDALVVGDPSAVEVQTKGRGENPDQEKDCE
jgi:hypothetical protein